MRAFGTRPAFIELLAACWLMVSCGDKGSAGGGLASSWSEGERAPNVLVVIADDLSSAAFGAFGGDAIETPGLDRLAEGGFRFRKAICASPFCTPSRQSFLTGRWPHSIGVTQLHSALDPKSQTLATVFSKAGYRTAAFGKMHWPRKVVGDATFGFDRVLGRKDWESALSSQDKVSYDEYRALWQHESREGWSTLNPARQPCPLAEDRQLAPWLIEHALTHLGSDSERPSLTFLSFYEPHAPFCFPERLKDAVDPATLDWDAWDRERRARDAPGLERWWRDRLRERGPFDESEMRATVAAHLQSVLWLDEQIAALLDELESSGLNENTIVLFWSDNGFFLGERGVIGKSFPYRRAAEVAMSLSGPGIVPGESAALVQTLDAFPTLCELAGIEPPADLHGRSLLPLLRGEDSIRSTAYTELVGVVASIQSNELKLMLGAGGNTGWDLVYDLVNDPEERHALTAEQVDSNAVLELKGEMYRLLRASPPDGFPIDEWMTQEDETDAIRWALRQIDATR